MPDRSEQLIYAEERDRILRYFDGEEGFIIATGSNGKVGQVRDFLRDLGVNVNALDTEHLLELERWLMVYVEPNRLSAALVAYNKADDLFAYLARVTGKTPKTLGSDVSVAVEMHSDIDFRLGRVDANGRRRRPRPRVSTAMESSRHRETKVEHWLKLERLGRKLREEEVVALYHKLKDIFVDRGGRGNKVRVEWDIELVAKNGQSRRVGEQVFVCSERIPIEVFDHFFFEAYDGGDLYSINTRIKLIEMLIAAGRIIRMGVIPTDITDVAEKQKFVRTYREGMAEAVVADIVGGVPHALIRSLQ